MSTPTPARSTFERALERRADDIVRQQEQRIAELQAGASSPLATRKRRTRTTIIVAVSVLVLLRLTVCGGARGRRGTEPIGAGAVATAEGAGVGSAASGFLPQVASQPKPAPTPTPAPVATPTSAEPRARAAPLRPRPAPRALPTLAPPTPAPTLADRAVGVLTPPTAVPTSPPVLNIGTRLVARLEAPLRTGAALAPATALLDDDVRIAGSIRLPAGTRLVGSAFAMPHDDRVQILWRAVVHDGRTLTFRGETLGDDGAPGLKGKVLDRRRKGVLRRVGAAVLDATGDVAAGAVSGSGSLGRAGSTLAGRFDRELDEAAAGREWLQADTVVELKAGVTCTVYVSADVLLPVAPVAEPPASQP